MDKDELYARLLNLSSNNKNDKKNMSKIIKNIKQFWWKYVLYTLTTGIVLLFTASFVFNKEITLNVMNSWIGVILGLVALVIGVISMFLSFYNLDQSINTQKETLSNIDSIKKEIIENVKSSAKEQMEAYKQNSTENRQTKYDVDNEKGGWINVGKK